MPISETQLNTWANLGSTGSATALYDRIKRALDNDATVYSHRPDVFLQGSYRNSTNIHGESDVDVLVMLSETYRPEYGSLTALERQRLEDASINASYQLSDFRRDVANAIRSAFPYHQVTEGGKSIKIPRTANNIPADVVPCLEYRLYQSSFGLLANPSYIPGIWLWDTKLNMGVVSFPKRHYDNGVTRQAQTGDWYKATVRMFKNARCWLEDHHAMVTGTASSFQIECLLYNVPVNLFGTSCQGTFVNVLNWLNKADMSQFTCQNGVQSLFGEGRWTTDKARAYCNALTKMYLEWGQ